MRAKLFWSILAACVALIVTVTVAAEAAQQAATRSRVAAALERQASTVAARIEARPVLVLRNAEALSQLDDFLAGVEASDDATLRVALVQGDRLVYLDGTDAPAEAFVVQALTTEEPVHERFRSGNRSETLMVAVPFTAGSRTGVVLSSRVIPTWSLGALMATWRLPLLFAVAVSAVAAMIVARQFTKRLRTLREAAEAYRSGRRVEIPVVGRDEIADVAQAFNDMAHDLDEARRRENEFLMDVSHDLRTPLTTIVGYSEMLETSDDDHTATVGRALSRESGRLQRLIGDLMLLGRLRASQFTARREPADLATVVRAVADGFRPIADRKGVRLELSTVPSQTFTDPERVQQMVGNLLDNALRHTPAGGTVTVSVEGVGDKHRIRVRDTGPGVPPARLDSLFRRLDAGPDRPAGSGLGLAIVRELAELLGGSVSARNTDPGFEVDIVL